MKNKYVLFLLLCICKLCLCRRRPSGSSWNGDPEAAIAVAFILMPNVVGWISYAITRKVINRPTTLVWIQNARLPHWFCRIPALTYVVIWTILYSILGYASYLVYKECDGFTAEAALPLSLYGSLLLLNGTWSPIYYQFMKFSLGFFHFITLDVVSVACTASFFFINPIAGYLMLPYLVFLVYLTVVSFIIWRMNTNTMGSTEQMYSY